VVTIPLASTPPGGLAPVRARMGLGLEGGDIAGGGSAEPETTHAGKAIWVSELLEEDPDPLWNVVTPPKVKAARPITNAGRDRAESCEAPVAPADDAERETLIGETELNPGIRVDPVTSPAVGRPPDGLESGEIEDVLQRLGDEGAVSLPAPSSGIGEGERSARIEEEPATMESSDGGPLGEGPGEDAKAEDEEADPLWQSSEAGTANGQEEASEASEEPDWLYRPSGEVAGKEPVAAPWMRWAGIGGAVILLAIGVAFVMSGRDDAVHPGPEESAPAGEGPPVVEAPAAPTEPLPERFEPSPGAAPDRDRVARAGSTPAKPTPHAAQFAAPATDSTLASPLRGDIFQSAPFLQGRSLLQQGRLRDASSRFVAAWEGRKNLYTVQLAVACEPETVARAFGSAGASTEFFILPKAYKGRSCYRLLWGSFTDRGAALRGIERVPRALLDSGLSPVPAPI